MNSTIRVFVVVTFLYFTAFSANAIGQSDSSTRSFNKTAIQLGVFSDFGNEVIWDRTYNFNKTSFNKISLSKLAFANEHVSQIALELSYYKDKFDVINGDPFMGSQMERSNAIVEIEYFKSLTKREAFTNQLHLGYLVSGYIQLEENISSNSIDFPINRQSLNLAPGIKALYARNIKNDLSFIISTEFHPFIANFQRELNSDPNIQIDLQTSYTIGNIIILRPRIGIDFGFVF